MRRTTCSALLFLLAGCGGHKAADDDITANRLPEVARLAPADEALAGAYLPALDPSLMNSAEIRKVLGAGSRCEFRYTSEGDPALAWRISGEEQGIGVVKLNGHLVAVETAVESRPLVLTAGKIRLSVQPDRENFTAGGTGEADVIFEAGQEVKAGYRGYYRCDK